MSTDAKRGFSLKLKTIANSGDPDETAQYEPYNLDLHYLHRYRDERVNLRVTESKKDESGVIDKAVKICRAAFWFMPSHIEHDILLFSSPLVYLLSKAREGPLSDM